MAGRFELKVAKNGQFHFNLLADNGQIIMQSEMYDSKEGALNGIKSLQRNAEGDRNYDRLISKSGRPYFVLKSGSHQVIGQSQQYETEAGRDNGIESIKKYVPYAEVADLSQEQFPKVNKIGSVRTFLKELEKIQFDDDHLYFYRGHSDVRYDLIPSIYRNVGWIRNENILFKELVLRCPTDFDLCKSTFQFLVKMQHYSLPTRLLDITGNPLIALYFATSENIVNNLDGEVVVFKIPKRDIKYYDSDTVSLLANISRRPADFSIAELPKESDKFNQTVEIKNLIHEINEEKPYFKPLIKREHLESVICVKPKLDNARIVKQDGAFLLYGMTGNKKTPAKVPDQFLIRSTNPLIINADKKKSIRNQLKAFGITRGAIYPDIENVANFIKDEFRE